MNYGAVGVSIGHEISHAFDDQGDLFDGDGNLRNWWTRQDAEQFAARDAALAAQVKSDPHSPAELRVDGSLRNHPGFHGAFEAKPGECTWRLRSV